MVKTEDPVWFHFKPIKKLGNRQKWARCKYCETKMEDNLEVMRQHQERCDGTVETRSDDSSSHTWISSIEEDDHHVQEDGLLGHEEQDQDNLSELANIDNCSDHEDREDPEEDEILKCVLCGDTAESSVPDSVQQQMISLWEENCSKSFCKLFSIPRSFRKTMILKALYCHRCRNILRDIDFSFRTLQLLEDKLQQSKTTVEALLKENYDTTITNRKEPREYKQLVKSFYHTVIPGNEDDEDDDEIEETQQVGHRDTKRVVVIQEDPIGIHEPMTTRRGRNQAPSPDAGAGSPPPPESDGGFDDNDDNLEFEAPPQVEVILKSGFNDLEVSSEEPADDPDVHTDDFSTPDNSSDEDWEMEPSSPKKKGKTTVTTINKSPSVKKVVRRVSSMAPRVAFKSETKTVLIVKKDEFVKKKALPPKPKPKIIRKVPIRQPPRSIGTGDGDRRVIWVNPDKPKPPRTSTAVAAAAKANQNAIGRLKCEAVDCTFTCSVKHKLEAHVNKIHLLDPTPFHCKRCDEKFASNTRFYLHQKKHRDEDDGRGGGSGEEKAEERDKTPLGPCKFCEKEFTSRRELRKHLAHRHPFGDMVSCSYCGKMYESDKQAELDEHEGVHRARLAQHPFICILCDAGFTNRQDLKTHVRQDHEPLLMPNKCKECNKVFDLQRQLKRHILAAHTQRSTDFKCSQCPFLGMDSKGLVRHMTSHDTARNFVCEVCGIGYKALSGLNYHIRASHSDTRNYACQICDKKFVSSCLLKAHEESHNREKSYVCESCGKAFLTQKSLYQHNKIHLGIKVRYGKRFKNRVISETSPKRRNPGQRPRSPSSSSMESEHSQQEERISDPLSSEPSVSSPVYERHEPLPAHFQGPSQTAFQQPLVPAPHFLMGGSESWDRQQPHSSTSHQFQPPNVGVDGYPFTTIDLSHTTQLLSVLHQQQQQRRASTAQFQNNNYFRNQH